MKTLSSRTLQLCLLGLLASSAWSFPFWLDAPTRDNRHDPKSSIFTPSSNSLPVAPPAGPVGHNGLVVDFEGSTPNDHTLWNGGGVITGIDSFGTTMTPAPPWVAADVSTPGSSSSYAACISGSMVVQNAGIGQYPYAFISLELTPGGGAQSSTAPSVDVSSYAPHNGLKFDYKAGVVGVAYRVKLLTPLITNGAYYEFDFTPANTNWNTVTVYFPGSEGASPNVFAQPSWNGTPVAFDKTKIGCINFEVIQQTSGPVNYSLCVDNVDFSVAAAPPLVTTCIMCFDGPDIMATDYSNHVLATGAGIGSNHGPGSTVNTYDASALVAGSGLSGPFGTDTNNLAVNLVGNTGPDFVVLELPFVPNGYPHGPASTDVTTYAPHQRITFEYKANIAGGMSYILQFVQEDFPAGNYGYYQYTWTPSDTAWHSLSVYFPGASGSPQLTLPSAGPAFNPGQAGELEFGPTWHSTATPYDITIDNIRFD